MHSTRTLAIALTLSGLGCSSVATGGIRHDQLEFNRKIVDTLDEQLLLNLVRLRYRDTPYFVEISNITAQQSVSGAGSLGATVGLPDPSSGRSSFGPGVAGSFTYTPTVVYSPLQGEAFVRRLVAPVPLTAAVVLSQSGWSIERVVRLTVDRINNVRNAPSAAAPTPLLAPDYAQFRRLAELLRAMQVADQVAFSTRGRESGDGFILLLDKDPAAQEIKELLQLDGSIERVPVSQDFTQPGNDRVTLRMRSVISSMFFLSQAVEVPPEHEAAGLVTITKNADGSRFDWKLVHKDLFRVQSGMQEPASAYVKTRHRGAWFWIEDDDLFTKTTFLMLSQLYSMQASNKDQLVPMLTLPAGR